MLPGVAVEGCMARRERLQVTGFPVHIIQRGNNRQACFFAEADHRFFLHHLGELVKRFKKQSGTPISGR